MKIAQKLPRRKLGRPRVEGALQNRSCHEARGTASVSAPRAADGEPQKTQENEKEHKERPED